MILEFRTERDRNGNALYLGIDTENKRFLTRCRGWIAKDMPVLKRRDRRAIIEKLIEDGFLMGDYMEGDAQ